MLRARYDEVEMQIEEMTEIISEYEYLIYTGTEASELFERELAVSGNLVGRNDISRKWCNS